MAIVLRIPSRRIWSNCSPRASLLPALSIVCLNIEIAPELSGRGSSGSARRAVGSLSPPDERLGDELAQRARAHRAATLLLQIRGSPTAPPDLGDRVFDEAGFPREPERLAQQHGQG